MGETDRGQLGKNSWATGKKKTSARALKGVHRVGKKLILCVHKNFSKKAWQKGEDRFDLRLGGTSVPKRALIENRLTVEVEGKGVKSTTHRWQEP